MPRIKPSTSSPDRRDDAGVVLAIYANLGTDPVLAWYPDGDMKAPNSHPMTLRAIETARLGVAVSLLLDLPGIGTTWLAIEASTGTVTSTPLGRLDLTQPGTLADFLDRTCHRFAERALVLSMEGHGAGFLPELDSRQVTFENITGHGAVAWRLGSGRQFPSLDASDKPLVQQGAPVLPVVSPTIGSNHPALSSWAMGEGLRLAAERTGVRPAVLHLNNCFNMSTELLHTVSPYAEVATGYCNYNFFTAGEAYPAVFARLAKAGSATPEELGRWFAEENHRVLAANGHEPTVGCTVQLSRMRDIVERVDDLSDALLAALRTVSAADRPTVLSRIQAAITRAQQYDSRPDFVLETPDELTDLDSLATELMKEDFGPFKVHAAAGELRTALSGIKVYGDKGTPWMSPGTVWDFSSRNLAMNIFLPDPQRRGLWDWRSQYYLDVNPDPSKPPVQPHIIDFVKITDWVDFLVEYHRDTPFTGLLPAAIPEFPVKSVQGDTPGCMRHRHPHPKPHGRDRDGDDRGGKDGDADDRAR